jgi:Integrase core domain
MDGKGRYLDNIFNERLWRSLEYAEVDLKTYASVAEARVSIGAWLAFYNDERLHQTLDYKTPREIFEAATPIEMWTTQQRALPTSLRWPFHQASLDGTFGQLRPQAQQQQQQQQQQKRSLRQTGKTIVSETLPLAA